MTDQSDKVLEELLQIKLGIERKCDATFKQLLKGNDPLDNIYKTILDYKNQNSNLKKDLIAANAELKKYKKIGSTSTSLEKLDQESQKKLPVDQNHEQNMQMVEEKKKKIQQARQQYGKQINDFVIFLIKCLREITRVPPSSIYQKQKQDENLQIIKQIQRGLQAQKNERLNAAPQPEVRKLQQPAKSQIQSQASTAQTRSQMQSLMQKLQKVQKNQEYQNIFDKIHELLGISQHWRRYQNNYKQSLQKIRSIQSMIKDLQVKNELKNLNFQPQKKAQSILSNIFHKKIKESQRNGEQTFNLVNTSIKYFFQKLDSLFTKHNQHPYYILNQQQFPNFDHTLRTLILQNQLQEALKTIKGRVDDAFYYIERRTKFHNHRKLLPRVLS